MTQPNREQLLGFLLGALDADEHEQIARQLKTDAELLEELAALAAELEPLESLRESFDPPADLVERTCDLIDEQNAARPRPVDNSQLVSARRVWSLVDLFTVACLFLAAVSLFVPAMANSRYMAQVNSCQHNLREVGVSLTNYANHHGGFFPEVPTQGNRAVAGIYAPILLESQWLNSSRTLICPASSVAAGEWQMPTLAEIDAARGLQLIRMQRAMGGSYGYNLGVLEDGQYRAPRNRGRSNFALMSDAPSWKAIGWETSNHQGRGQNILFECGSVRFISRVDLTESMGENPFLSRRGYIEPGRDSDDAVIGRSSVSPVIDSLPVDSQSAEPPVDR